MKKNTSFLPELERASGPFDYPLTNDYMFRSLCQKSNKALKGLLSALLRIPPKQIHSVVITNPIVVGEACTDKEFRLDVRAELNGNKIVNIEMQIARACLKNAFCQMCVTICGRFAPNEGRIAGYVT